MMFKEFQGKFFMMVLLLCLDIGDVR